MYKPELNSESSIVWIPHLIITKTQLPGTRVNEKYAGNTGHLTPLPWLYEGETSIMLV